jgi:uncharacterized membrane protein
LIAGRRPAAKEVSYLTKQQEATVSIQRRNRAIALLLLLVIAVGCTSPIGETAGTGLESSPQFSRAAHVVAKSIEIVGIAIIVIGAILASVVFLREWTQGQEFKQTYRQYRERLGQAILLGLEFLVAADIIGTVAVDPTFRNVGILGAVVAIRTFLSFALEVEIQGRWPWQGKNSLG